MKNKEYISSLTSLRGIAALLVIIFHFDLIFFRLAAPGSSFFVRRGYLWVDFFFLLSGFIMMYVYEKSFSDGVKLQNYKKFMRARFARIYPLHIFAFLSMIAFYFWYTASNKINLMDTYTFNMKAIYTNLLLLQSMHFHDYLSWNTPSWSISTEWWMYVLFPFILIPFRKVLTYKKSILFFILAGYAFIVYYLHPLSNAMSPFSDPKNAYSLDVTYDYGFLRCFLGFLFGMFIYELYKIRWRHSLFVKERFFLYTVGITLIVLSFKIPDFIPIILFAIILLSSAYSEGKVKKILSLRPLLFLGDISYSIYLMHMPILLFLLTYARRFPGIQTSTGFALAWFYCLCYVAIVLIASALTYKLIEVPIRKKINSL